MEKKSLKVFHCNVELTLDIIGGKWKPLILYHIGNSKVLRYGELKRKIPNINERVLSRQLRELEEHRVVHREDYKEVPPKVEYSLTVLGESLKPMLLELGRWGKEYNDKLSYGLINFEDEYHNE